MFLKSIKFSASIANICLIAISFYLIKEAIKGPFLTYSSFLLSAPGVATITFSGIITSAPLAVAAPLNIVSTICLKVSTIAPSVMYSAFPLI